LVPHDFSLAANSAPQPALPLVIRYVIELDQASTLVDLLHGDTAYPAGSRVLEAGCGVGAQTVALARNSPDARITFDKGIRDLYRTAAPDGVFCHTFFKAVGRK
jgi:hypothetical protein